MVWERWNWVTWSDRKHLFFWDWRGEASLRRRHLTWDPNNIKNTTTQKSHLWGATITYWSSQPLGQQAGGAGSKAQTSQSPSLFTPVCYANVIIFSVLYDIKSIGKYCSSGENSDPSRRKARWWSLVCRVTVEWSALKGEGQRMRSGRGPGQVVGMLITLVWM